MRVEDAFGGIPCPHIDEEALCAVEPCIATPAITLAESIWIMRDDLGMPLTIPAEASSEISLICALSDPE